MYLSLSVPATHTFPYIKKRVEVMGVSLSVQPHTLMMSRYDFFPVLSDDEVALYSARSHDESSFLET